MQINIGMWVTIFMINVVYVTLNTLRLMLTMKGYRLGASVLSFVETVIYISGLGLVMENLDSIMNIIVYGLGFSVGIYVGIMIEDRLALGWVLAEAIIPENGWEVAEKIREKGYGVTISEAYGRSGSRFVLEILTPRSNERDLYRLIEEIDSRAFVISHEPKYVNGGFWTKRVRKNRKQMKKDQAAEKQPAGENATEAQ